MKSTNIGGPPLAAPRTLAPVLGFALATMLALPAANAKDDVCDKIEAGEKIEGELTTNGCTVTLSKDTTIEGGGTITASKGVLIKLNKHQLTVKDININFGGPYAIAIHGNDDDNETVTFSKVTLHDTSSKDCAKASGRMGAILWKVKSATLEMTATDAKVRHGVVFGAPMSGDHKPPAEQGEATVEGSIAFCLGGSWPHNKNRILAFERAAKYAGGVVESVGPCDFEDPVLVSLRDTGLPGPM